MVSPFVDRRHGTERALAELLERLARDYHCEIHLYAQRTEDLVLSRSAACSNQESGAILWHKVPSIPGPHLLQFLFWLIANRIWRAWHRGIRGLQFDLVFSPGINCFDADLVIVHALFHSLQKLAQQENKTPRPGFYRRFHRRAYYSLLTWLERRIYSNSKVSLAAVSRRTAALLNRYFHRQDVRVIPNGVDAVQFSPSRRLALRAEARFRRKFLETDFVLLLIGNDWRNKGLSAILAAMAARPEIPLRLLVAGRDAMALPFLEAARSLGLNEKCRWETSSVDAIDLYAAGDLYVSPSCEDSFGLPVLEAMACGLPVITSVNAGVSELMRDGIDGFILRDPRDSRALAQLLGELFGNAQLRNHIGEAAAEAARGWTWDRNAAAVWEFLKQVTARKSPSHGLDLSP